MKNTITALLLSTAPIFAGEPAPMIAPAPAPDCPAGWTVGLEVLALKSYQSEGEYSDDSDWDAGYRGSIGYEFGDCLFIKATGFGFNSDFDGKLDDDYFEGAERFSVDMKAAYIDLVIGQHFSPDDNLTLSPYVGLRWAKFEENLKYDGGYKYETDFDGLGIVVGIDATRSLGNNISLYGTAKQSIVFGDTDYSSGFSGQPRDSQESDNVGFVSELGIGLQYDFTFSNVAANVRLGAEGQWWSGVSDGDSEDIGLAGFVLGANFRF